MTVELGVNTDNSPDQRRIEADLDLAVDLGFRWVRTSQEMHWGFGDTGAYALGVIERYAAACADRGLRLIQCCQGMPASLARGGQAGHYGPKDAASARKWGDWFGECAARVAVTNGITSCGNEWDNYGWDTTPSVRDCATLHAAALFGRDARAPDAIFATCEMAPDFDPEPLAFLQAIVKTSPSILDAKRTLIGWHPYVDPRYKADEPALWNTNYRMRAVDTWLAAAGHPKMKIMGGEWGVANGPVGNPRALTPVKVADYVRTQYLPSFDRMVADGVRLTAMCWYQLRDSRQAKNWPDFCGIVDVNGNLKPVAQVLQTYNGRTP